MALPQTGYSKTEFATALSQAGLSEANDGDLVRRLMQFLKRQGVIDYNDANALWSLTDLGRMRLPHQTLPLLNMPQVAALPIGRDHCKQINSTRTVHVSIWQAQF